MKQSDVAAKQAHDREDWQKRGLGGLVSAVDAASGTITISQPSLGGSKVIAIHTTKSTILRRYPPDSAKMEDAKRATLAETKAGDQLQARGARSADGSGLDAEEIVFGTFRNLSGTVISADAAANTITVLDLVTKKPVLVRVTAESQLHKLPTAAVWHIAGHYRQSLLIRAREWYRTSSQAVVQAADGTSISNRVTTCHVVNESIRSAYTSNRKRN